MTSTHNHSYGSTCPLCNCLFCDCSLWKLFALKLLALGFMQ
jgi:hypothetical protein